MLLLSPKILKFFYAFFTAINYKNKIYRHKRSIINFLIEI